MKKTLAVVIKVLAAIVWLVVTAGTIYVLVGVSDKNVSSRQLWGWLAIGGLFWLGVSLLCFNIVAAKQEEDVISYADSEPAEEEAEEVPDVPETPVAKPADNAGSTLPKLGE